MTQQSPHDPAPAATGATPVVSSGIRRKGNKTPLIVLIVIVALLLLAVIFAIVFLGGKNDSASGGAEGGYVDNSGAQVDVHPHAPGESDAVRSMSLSVAGHSTVVDPLQLTDQDVLLPPEDVSRVGWYSASTVPGSGNSGSSVITGHINEVSQGEGFAYYFTKLEKGDKVRVTVNSEPYTYEVTEGPIHVQKEDGLPDVVNDTENPNQLVLVTCGGQFIGGSLGYEDNIVVVASPVEK